MDNDLYQFNNIKQEINSIILERSKYLINKKFEKYNIVISKIYSKYNINKSRRIDILGSPQIDINNLSQILIIILKEINLFLLELSSPKDIFISFFLITSQKENEMEGIIKNLQHEIIIKSLTEKYNNIFYEEKIKPNFLPIENNYQINNDEYNEEIVIKEINISEYNSKGKKIKNRQMLLEENENNMKEYNIEYKDKEENRYIINTPLKVNKNNSDISKVVKLGQNILYIEILPRILIDYLMANPNLAFVEIDEEFSNELKIYNKELLHKIQEYDELYSKHKIKENNIIKIGNELNQNSLQLKKIQKSIELYEQLIIEKKQKGENAIFLDDMLNKLKNRENEIINNIKEMQQQSIILNMKPKFNRYDFYKKKILMNNSSNLLESSEIIANNNIKSNSISNLKYREIPKILFDNNNNNQIMQNISERTNIIKKYKLANSTNKMKKFSKLMNNESQILNNINYGKGTLSTKSSILQTITSMEKDSKRIFTKNKNEFKKLFTVELTDEVINNALDEIFNFYTSLNKESDSTYIDLDLFKRFCKDFKIVISDSKLQSIFYQSFSNENNTEKENNQYLETDNMNKINFNQFKLVLNKLSLELHEMKKKKFLRMISDKKSIINYMELREYLRQEEEKNHNKFTEKITGHIPKKSLEKNQFEFISKYKKIKTEISELEFNYEKESKKSPQKVLESFYQFLGLGYLPNVINCYKNKIKIKSNIFVENALKKYGNMNIFRNYQNLNMNSISLNTKDTYNNFNSSITNKNTSLTLRTNPSSISTNLLNMKMHSNKISTNDSIKLIPNSNNPKNLDNKIMINNNRYNLNDIDELEEIEPSLVDNKKMMNKNFSAFELKGINSFSNMSILPKINNASRNNNIRYEFLKKNNTIFLEN